MVITEQLACKCLYSPLSESLKDEMLPKMPMIAEYRGGKGKIPINDILRYVILTYDVQSPAQREVRDYYQRKRTCAQYVGFPTTPDGKWRDDAVAILLGADEWFNSLMSRYLSLLALPEYTLLIALLELLARRTKKIFDGLDDDKTHTIINALTDKIKELTNKIFGSGEVDEIQQARRALYAQAEDDRLRLRPEDVIALMNEGGIPASWSPYGEDYEVGKIVFIGDRKPMIDID